MCPLAGKGEAGEKLNGSGNARRGVGDVFSSIIAAGAVNGVEFSRSVRRASEKCILRSIELRKE